MLSIIQVAVLVGLLYSLVVIGVGLAFRLLDYPDLTLEGGAIFAATAGYLVYSHGSSWWLSLLSAGVAGACAGGMTAIFHLLFGVSRLLSGVITSAILYSVNLRLLGGVANRRLPSAMPTVFDLSGMERTLEGGLVVASVFVFGVLILLWTLLYTRFGFLLKAIGENERFAVFLGRSPKVLLFSGLCLANFLVGLSMGLLLQYRRVVDVNMVGGLLVSTLAALVLGEITLQPRSLPTFLVAMVAGSILYNLLVAVALHGWFDSGDTFFRAGDVRLMTGALLLGASSVLVFRRGQYKLFSSKW